MNLDWPKIALAKYLSNDLFGYTISLLRFALSNFFKELKFNELLVEINTMLNFHKTCLHSTRGH